MKFLPGFWIYKSAGGRKDNARDRKTDLPPRFVLPQISGGACSGDGYSLQISVDVSDRMR